MRRRRHAYAGGLVGPVGGGMAGEATTEVIRQRNVDFALSGASATDEDGSVLDFEHCDLRLEITAEGKSALDGDRMDGSR